MSSTQSTTARGTRPGGAISGDLPAGQAIPRLVDAHGGRLYGLGLKLCGNPEDAEDLVQEVFLLAYRKWHQFEGRSDPSSWLYTIGARACQRMHRRRSGEPSRMEPLADLLPSEDEAVPDPEAEGPLDEQLRREAREVVDRALETLPPDFRIALVLKDIAELSVAEVARVLGVKEATVKTRVHRARLALRKALEKELPGPAGPGGAAPRATGAHPRSVCLDLLRAKQEAMDRGEELPVPDEVVCDRCRALFASLDLTRDLCREVADGELPPELREMILRSVG
ncbi:MAG: RNA polymerase sigma factor [Acidobacteriota bacterium]